jgi:hypothetical protein
VHRTWLQSFFVALRINTSLKKLNVNGLSLSDELVCRALGDVFAKNSALEELSLHCDSDSLLSDTEVASWHRTLPFLRDNKILKPFSLCCVNVEVGYTHAAVICIDTVAIGR